MKSATARFVITQALKQLDELYGQPVFDEWAMLALRGGQGSVLAYVGPRAEAFRQQLPRDAAPILALVAGQKFTTGDFEFAPQGRGTSIDALVHLGEGCFLVCNNTAKSMAEIRADAKWLKAQTVFVQLCELFRADPLVP